MNSLNQVISDINNPAITGQSLQQGYTQLAQANNLPALQSELLNYQNIMSGTEHDIRSEIQGAGGFATDSQVLGMTAARNNVILKQYNTLRISVSSRTNERAEHDAIRFHRPKHRTSKGKYDRWSNGEHGFYLPEYGSDGHDDAAE